TFGEIEDLLGASLPKSARKSKAWWSNRRTGGLQSASWIGASYRVKEVDFETGNVAFQKRGVVLTYNLEKVGGTVLWNGELVKALREYMEVSQAELADEMGMRQQTISDWETGAHKPTRSTSRFLSLIAERAGFEYDVTNR
ncbi:MAG: helix-turn-helix transcriptional regulator, partial [Chloroflexota bacterium]